MSEGASSRGLPKGLCFALLCQWVLSLGYLFVTPAFEAPDEGDHLRYAFHISHTGELPIIRGTWKEVGRPKLDEATQAYHPPAYYGLLAGTMRLLGARDTTPSLKRNPAFADWEGQDPGLHLLYLHGDDERWPVSPEIRLLWMLRFWSVLFGLVAVFATHRLGRLAFPGKPVIADLAAVLLACVPKWSYMHGVINNGIPASSLSHVVVLLLALALVRRRLSLATGVGVGLLAGLAVMSKLTALFLLPVMFSVYVLGCWAWKDSRRQTLWSALLALGSLAAVTAGFFLRNLELYGSFMALDVHQVSFHERIRVPPEQAYQWITEHFYPNVFTSLVGHMGWWIQPPLRWLVVSGAVLSVLALFGWVLRWLRPSPSVAESERELGATDARPMVVALLGGVALIVFAVTLRYNFMMKGPHARYLFPALGPMAILFSAGLVALGDRLSVGLGRLRPVALGLPLVLGAGVLWFQFRPDFLPELAPGDRWHASLMADLAHVPERPELTLLSPQDGAQLSEAPEFRWLAEDDPEAVYSLQIFSESGRVLVATHAFFWQELRGGSWQLPAQGWELLPMSQPLSWKVRRVPDRSQGQSMRDVPASGAFSLTRLLRE